MTNTDWCRQLCRVNTWSPGACSRIRFPDCVYERLCLPGSSVKGASFAVSARRRNSSSLHLMVWLPLAWYCDSHHQRDHTRRSCPVSEAIKLAQPHTHGCSQTRSSCSSNLKSKRHYQELLTLLTADLETNSTAYECASRSPELCRHGSCLASSLLVFMLTESTEKWPTCFWAALRKLFASTYWYDRLPSLFWWCRETHTCSWSSILDTRCICKISGDFMP
jgi:hypothetical protein